MGERKVVNKYYPPDFDPSKLPRFKQPKNQQVKVRMSLPMTMICNTCGNYLGGGKKFNMRKEQIANEFYLNIPILRFYFKCTHCCKEITFKTDPENSHYKLESGANCRRFKTTTQQEVVVSSRKRVRDSDDVMKCLEKKNVENKREMERVVALEELMCLKSRHAKVIKSDQLFLGGALTTLRKDHQEEVKKNKTTIDHEAMVKRLFKNNNDTIKRDEDEDATERRSSKKLTQIILPDLTPTKGTPNLI